MINNKGIFTLLSFFIAAVWFINGVFCKVLNLVPRHQMIVSEILGKAHAPFITKAIGIAELGMAVWILARITSRLNAIVQIIIIAMMNLIEFVLVPDLLLFGRCNSVLALLFICLIYYNEFRINTK